MWESKGKGLDTQFFDMSRLSWKYARIKKPLLKRVKNITYHSAYVEKYLNGKGFVNNC